MEPTFTPTPGASEENGIVVAESFARRFSVHRNRPPYLSND